MQRVGIALGSNLGNRLAHLQAARDALHRLAPPANKLLQASIYQTEPLLCPAGSPDFYNTVVEIFYAGTPEQLLEQTQAIEKNMGREVIRERNAPRVIDVDLLYFGDRIDQTESLILPHPRLTERRFVLEPLAEIRPQLVLPGLSRTVGEIFASLITDEPPLVRVTSEW